MKKLFKFINIIVAIIALVSAMAVDTSDIAMKVCLISAGYLFLYMCGKDIVKAVISFVSAAMKEEK